MTATTTIAEQEVRAEFERWFAESAAKDLDAMMTHIAPGAISYEHDAPLQYAGAGAIREVCRRGLEFSRGEFRWDIPDLQVIVRDDIAVTWGLNRMWNQEPGQESQESWSRGTRIFQKIDGKWLMIHQHVSFPYDLETGAARTDLRP